MREIDTTLEPGANPGLAPPTVISPEEREEMEALLGAFRQWLVEAESLGAGALTALPGVAIDGVPVVDMHTLVAELTALRSEVRLEARATKAAREKLEGAASAYETGLERSGERVAGATARLEESVAGAVETLSRENDRLRSELERVADEAPLRAVQALFETHDALVRGLKASEEARRRLGWRTRLLPRALFGGLLEGYEMGLERIRRLLTDAEVSEIPCHGMPFDPTRMRSVEVRPAGDAEPGTVLEVLRAGFERRGRVLRVAEVSTAGVD